jgi:hypothetical protein
MSSKISLSKSLILVASFCLAIPLAAEAAFIRYNELMIKDYDEMQKIVQSFVKKARKASEREDESGDSEAVEQLREGLKVILSRPDNDNMVAKLVPEVRRELLNYNKFEDVVTELVADAMAPLKQSNSTVSVRSTCLVILQNLLAEIKPEVVNGNERLKTSVQTIADAKIEIADDVKKDRRLRGMFKTVSPSDEAKAILKMIPAKK